MRGENVKPEMANEKCKTGEPKTRTIAPPFTGLSLPVSHSRFGIRFFLSA